MVIFKRNNNRSRSRDAPAEHRELPKNLENFIKSVDFDEGGGSMAGISVSEESAMRTSAVYACVKILAETVASLPLHLYKKNGNKKSKAEEHPLFSCLYEIPNAETTSFNFREVMMTALLLWGNAYARIIRDKQGHVKELWYLRPDLMTVSRDNNKKLKYDYADENGGMIKYRPDQIFHVKGLSYDGVKGLSPIGQMKEAIGLSLATESYGAAFFGNGARPGGVIEYPGTLKDPEKLRESWNKVFQGSKNSNKTAVLEAGAKFHTIGLPPEESQFLETRKFQINEICRIFRVPPHLVGDLEKATFSNIEHQSIEFVQHTIRPWLVRWEQEISRSLLSDEERTMYFARFNVDGLLRGDYASRMQGYATARQNGWMSANDIRELEEMNPISGGDIYLVNGNMVQAKNQDKGGTDGQQKGIQDASDDGAQS
jgi:HK97 family phage portal protein